VLRAVLDANVYVSAFVRPEGPPGQLIERFLRDAAFEIILSPAIVEEVLQALAYPKVRKHIRANVDPELWFEDIVVLAQFIAGEHEVHGVSDDPDDDKYIAAGVEGRAAFVVSGDPDLLAIREHEGLRFVTPRAFLDLLGT
jgi:putative PIN family toxin of toxin-antitoxin system